MEAGYRFYAQVFLGDQARDAAVQDTFATLWLRWETALRSPDTRAFAWSILRTHVMTRTTHRDGRPELEAAVVDAVALHTQSAPEAVAARMTRIVANAGRGVCWWSVRRLAWCVAGSLRGGIGGLGSWVGVSELDLCVLR
ncbi:hypothetical protein [Streptomyces halstedii]|uniref:hypothetical protein n=1 Tax=Streptomyces halstedii TaxID=1944 RepID=UPI00368BF308